MYLLIGFITPALIFVLLGLFVCMKKTTYDDKSEYQSIDSEDIVRFKQGAISLSVEEEYQTMYQNRHFVPFENPPPYSEGNISSSFKSHMTQLERSKHLPPNQPRILAENVRPPYISAY